ncbi:unnamed protein product [Larinioides sclopetarius]|uniref:Uncharacterized protein n=1 Tax=Larinioides sclopetarius TaxID=280406 RepID=A0AAV2BF59_9ARAC
MAVLNTIWCTLLALLGLNICRDFPSSEEANTDICLDLKVTNGYVVCDRVGSQVFCNIVCDGKQQGDFVCTKGKGWAPKLPKCAKPNKGGDICRGLKVTNGTAKCHPVKSKMHCDVKCNGKHYGDFSCTKGKGWVPKLPKCAKPMEGSTLEEAYPEKPCSETCENLCRLSDLRSRCVGPNQSKCECYE